MKKIVLSALLSFFFIFITVNVFAAEDSGLNSKEMELLKQNVSFLEEFPIAKFGKVEIYSCSNTNEKNLTEKEISVKIVKGCVPVQISDEDKKQFKQIVFSFSLGQGKKQNVPTNIVIYKKLVAFPQATFSVCPSSEDLKKERMKKNKGQTKKKETSL